MQADCVAGAARGDFQSDGVARRGKYPGRGAEEAGRDLQRGEAHGSSKLSLLTEVRVLIRLLHF